ELQETRDGVEGAGRSLPDLQEAADLVVDHHRHEQEQEIGGIAGPGPTGACRADPAVRQQVERPGLHHEGAEQLLVRLAHVLGAIEADLPHVDLELELEVALGGARPDGAGRRRQAFEQPLEHFPIKHRGKDVAFAQTRDFFQATGEPATLLLDYVNGLFGNGAHNTPSWTGGGKSTMGKVPRGREAVLAYGTTAPETRTLKNLVSFAGPSFNP